MTTDRAWPSVAVVVPNHQRVKETLRAVRSAVDQEYPGRLRIYLVYERRPDEAALLECLPPGVEAIGFTSQTDANPIAAKRNAALVACDEDLVGFLDDDDLWHRQKIRRQVEAMQSVTGAVGCSTGYITFSDDVRWPELGDRPPVVVSRSAVLRASTIVTSSMLADGPTVRELGFDERPEWLAVEDFYLWNRLRARGPIAHVPAPLVGIRVDPSTSSRQSRSRQHVKTLAVLAELAAAGRDWEMTRAAAEVATRAALSARGTVDPLADALLRRVLDGRLFGHFDPAVAGAIRSSWRSRRLVPALYGARDRLARHRQDPGLRTSSRF
jgi:glycosyltransferase involved in cell wall biosynthesis